MIDLRSLITIFTVLQLFLTPSVSKAVEILQGDTLEVCSLNYPITLNTTPGLTQYQWSNGSTTHETTINQAGTYWVSVVNNGNVERDTIVVIDMPLTTEIFTTDKNYQCIDNIPWIVSSNDVFDNYGIWNTGDEGNFLSVSTAGKYWFTSIDSMFCLIQIDTVDVIGVAGGSELHFNSTINVCAGAFPADIYVQLGDNPVWLDSSTSYFLTVDSIGSYWYQSELSTCAIVYDTITVNAITLSPPTLCCDTSACLPDSIPLSLPPGYVDYFWSTGQNAQSIHINKAGLFDIYVTVTDTNNCTAVTDTITVELFDSIPTPTITQNGIFLVVTPAGYNYQWYKNDTLIIGATQPAILDTLPGTYCARIYRGICFDTICYTVVDTNKVDTTVSIIPITKDLKNISITPNPAKDFITLKNLPELSIITITDAIGRTWIESIAYKQTTEINIAALPQGIYLINLQSNDGKKITKRLLKH